MSGTVVCAGGAVRDLTYRLHAALLLGTSNPAALAATSGGVARNVSEYLAALGCEVQMVTAVGADDAGSTIVAELGARGVGTRNVQRIEGGVTAQYAAVIDPAGELTIGLAAMDILDRIEPHWLDDAWPAPGDWLFCDANLRPDVLAHAVSRAQRDGTGLVIDAVSIPKVIRLPPRLDGVEMLACNAGEASTWLRHNGSDASGEPADLVRGLLDAGARSVVLTLGAGGVLAAGASGLHHVPAPSVTIGDVTGAGDALTAGAMASIIGGSTLAAAAEAGTRLAAEVLAVSGSGLAR